MLVTGGRRQPSGVLNPFIRLAAFFGSDGLIVAATPSKVSRMVFLDNALAESDVLLVESVIDPPFPAFSLNFLAIPVRPSADPLKRSTSFECNSIRALFDSLSNSTSIADAGAAATADDADIDADTDAVDIVADVDEVDDNDDAVTADIAAAMDFSIAIAVAVPLLVSLACLFFLLRDKDICICDTIFAEPAGAA